VKMHLVLRKDLMKFDFNLCPHLQKEYEILPIEVKTIFDPYVIIVRHRDGGPCGVQ
jgi:hypothetical protein